MVSVLINNYNYEQYLEESIESVLGQTFQDWELIIVDDGSKDRSREIIKKYEQLYPGKITGVYKENGGQASALNAGLALAKGEIVAFLDSDDYWFPNKLEAVVPAHETHDYVVHKFQTNGPEKPLCDRKFLEKSSALLKRYGFPVRVSTPTSSISFRKSLLEKFFPIPEEDYRISADAYIDFFALYFSNYYYIDEALTFYRFHEGNGYYGKESLYDARKFYCRILENVNRELEKRCLPLIPRRNLESQRRMYREADGFEIAEGRRYVIYGAGEIGEHVLDLVKLCGGKAVYFCDGNEKRAHTMFRGCEILSPAELAGHREAFDQIVVASTTYADEIGAALGRLGFEEGKDYIGTSLFSAILFGDDME